VTRGRDVILLAVKPQNMDGVQAPEHGRGPPGNHRCGDP
jgi:hypothetical protein